MPIFNGASESPFLSWVVSEMFGRFHRVRISQQSYPLAGKMYIKGDTAILVYFDVEITNPGALVHKISGFFHEI